MSLIGVHDICFCNSTAAASIQRGQDSSRDKIYAGYQRGKASSF